MIRNIFASVAVAGLGIVAVAMPSFAGSLTGGTATSTTSVSEECQWYAAGSTGSANAVTLAFGAYSPFSASDTDAATPATGIGALAVYCTKGTAGITIWLSEGVNSVNNGQRMKNGTNFINYELYKETGRTNLWGGGSGVNGSPLAAIDSTSATTPIVSATGATTIFGRIPKNQNVAVGAAYTDTVTITVNY